MEFQLIALLGATSLLAACSHDHGGSPKHDCHYMGVKGAPTPASSPDHVGKAAHDCDRNAHHARAAHTSMWGSEPYQPNRAAPFERRRQDAPETVKRDNYPFWR